MNPYIAVLLGATLGGFNGVIVKWLNVDALTTTFFRLIVPAVVMFVYLKYKKNTILKGNYKLMFSASFINAIRLILYYLAFLYTSVGNAVIILFSWPIFSAIWDIVWLKQRKDRKSIVLILLAFAGIVLMYMDKQISFTNKDYIGMIAMLISAILYSIQVIIFKKESHYYTETENIFYQNIVGAILLIPVLLFVRPHFELIPSMTILVYQGIITGIIAYLLFFYGLKHLKMNHYSLFSYWEVPASVMCAMIFLHEALTWNMVVGGILIIVAGLGLLITKQKIEKV